MLDSPPDSHMRPYRMDGGQLGTCYGNDDAQKQLIKRTGRKAQQCIIKSIP